MKANYFLSGLLLSAGLTACASQTINVLMIEPKLVPLKHNSTINITTEVAHQIRNVSITPGGAYIEFEKTQRAARDLYVALGAEQRILTYLPKENETVLAQHNDNILFNHGHSIFLKKINSPTARRLGFNYLPARYSLYNNSLCVYHNNVLIFHNIETEQTSKYSLPDKVTHIQSTESGCITAHEAVLQLHTRTATGNLGNVASKLTNAVIHSLDYYEGRIVTGHGSQGFTLYDSEKKLGWLGGYNKHAYVVQSKINNNQVLTVGRNGVITQFDVSDPGTPLLNGELVLGDSAQIKHFTQQHALIASDNRLLLADFSTTSSPAVSHLGVNLGGSRRAQVVGNLLYVADWFSGVHIYDIRHPHAPTLTGSFHTPGSPKGVWIENNIAYIADDDHGLQILDVSNPGSPVKIANLELDGLAYTMKKRGSLLFLAAHYGGFHIIDVSNPRKPKRIGGVDTPSKAWAVALKDQYLFVADDFTGVLIFDISNPRKPLLKGQFNPDGLAAEDIVIRGNTAYVAFFDGGLFTLDISNPQKPEVLSHIATPGNARGIALHKNSLYLASWEAGVLKIDISKPEQPSIISQFDTSGATWGVSNTGDIIYALDWWGGVKIIDFSDSKQAKYLSRYQAGDLIKGIELRKEYAYLAQGSLGLQVFDIRNPLNPVWAGGVHTGKNALDVALVNQTAIIVDGTSTIQLYNIEDPFIPRHTKTMRIAVRAENIVAEQDTILLWNTQSAQLLNLQDGMQQQIHTAEKIRDAVIFNSKLYILTESGLNITDAAPNNDLQLTTYPLDANKIRVNQHGIYLVHDKQLSKRQLSNPKNIVASIGLPGRVRDFQLSNSRIYISDNRNVFSIVNSNHKNLAIEAQYPSSGNLRKIAVNQYAAFFAGETRLTSTILLPPVAFTAKDNMIQLNIPANLPIGSYHLTLDTTTLANAFEIGFPKPKKPAFSMEDLKRIMEQKSFKGKAPRE